MTTAQRRMVQLIEQRGGAVAGPNGGAEYWDVVGDWADASPRGLVLTNINRTFACLLRMGTVILDDDGYVHLVRVAR